MKVDFKGLTLEIDEIEFYDDGSVRDFKIVGAEIYNQDMFIDNILDLHTPNISCYVGDELEEMKILSQI